MKTYSVYIYHPNKEGYEKWEFIENIETDQPEKTARQMYIARNNGEGYKTIFSPFSTEIRVKYLEALVTINKKKYSSIYTAFNGSKDEIVLAERIK